MEQIKGRYCKDCVVYSNTLEQDARSIIYGFVDHPMFEGSKIRIMPDAHASKSAVVGTSMTLCGRVRPSMLGPDIGMVVMSCNSFSSIKSLFSIW